MKDINIEFTEYNKKPMILIILNNTLTLQISKQDKTIYILTLIYKEIEWIRHLKMSWEIKNFELLDIVVKETIQNPQYKLNELISNCASNGLLQKVISEISEDELYKYTEKLYNDILKPKHINIYNNNDADSAKFNATEDINILKKININNIDDIIANPLLFNQEK